MTLAIILILLLIAACLYAWDEFEQIERELDDQ